MLLFILGSWFIIWIYVGLLDFENGGGRFLRNVSAYIKIHAVTSGDGRSMFLRKFCIYLQINKVFLMKMEAVCFAETSVYNYKSTWDQNPDGLHRHFPLLQNLTSQHALLPRFKVIKAQKFSKSMKMAVFWNVARCGLVDIERSFTGTYCLRHQGDELMFIKDVNVFLKKEIMGLQMSHWWCSIASNASTLAIWSCLVGSKHVNQRGEAFWLAETLGPLHTSWFQRKEKQKWTEPLPWAIWDTSHLLSFRS